MTKKTHEPISKFIQVQFSALADAEKAPAMAAYMKTDQPFYGIQKPERMPVYKQLKKQFPAGDRAEYEKNVGALWSLPHREEKYAALYYASSFPEFLAFDSLPLYATMIRQGAWWDLVDDIAINLVGGAYFKSRTKMKATIDQWTTDPDLWIRRTTLICHNHHKKETDQDQLFKTCLLMADEKEFFIRKAIGWALREYSYVDPKAVQTFVLKHKERLSPLSYREGTKQLVRSGFMKA